MDVKKDVDYSLYLVTDSTPAMLGDKDLVAVVKAAIEGGIIHRNPYENNGLVLTCDRRDDRPIP